MININIFSLILIFQKILILDESYNGNFNFLSTGFQKIYETNKYEALINK